MAWVGFEPTITALERAKTVHVLDRSATVTGNTEVYCKLYVHYDSIFWQFIINHFSYEM
jgi:hypothetical protein